MLLNSVKEIFAILASHTNHCSALVLVCSKHRRPT